MELRPKHQEQLRRLLEPVLERMPVPEYKRLHPNFSAKRIRWDYMAATGPNGHALLLQDIYPYASEQAVDAALESIFGGGN